MIAEKAADVIAADAKRHDAAAGWAGLAPKPVIAAGPLAG
jgi:hypothetical protein